MTPLRSVEAGPLFFECWIEEGHETQASLSSQATSQSQSQSQRSPGLPLA